MAKEGKLAAVPKLRFPEFLEAEDWGLKHGDDLFNAINNRGPSEALPILAITQEHGAIPRDQINYHVSVTEQSIESYKSVEKGDFIISLRSFQGGIEYSNYRGICSPAYVILRRKCKGSDGYFRHLFKSARFIQQLTRNIEGLRDGKMISYRQFSEQLIPTPIPAEQQKIGDCLTSLDELVAAQGRKVQALKSYKRGLMQQLFPREGETLPRLRFPEFRDAPEWEERQLDTCFSHIRNGFVGTATPFYVAGGSPYLQGKNVKKGRINPSGLVTVSKDFHDKQKKSQLRRGDIVMVQSGHVGECALIDGDFVGANCHALIIMTPIERLHPPFFVHCFGSDFGVRLIAQITIGNTIKHILAREVKALVVRVPHFTEQQRIADCLSSIDDLISRESRKLDALKTHKKGLMQQLFPASEEA
ncbi:restriction endonuclease subunit S [Dechloromonas denitrificans]|uniref:restriction endonuclease subunit S n=1 Tax=Dechloromonas denitrificans TaxID=281362 RepID=UPI001CFB1D10|nr:restriction endonuclease subunit S [Dechloromonas denitrificans]UCV08391.1 restriction endonuclease subunit S [Dechloromonas denitrificans]